MTYLSVSDFKHGLNRLRPQVAGIPGSLWTAKNCVIGRGGDIEAAKKFVAEYALPAGTLGLAGLNGRPYVFGTGNAPAGMPSDVAYQKLTYSGSATAVKFHDAKSISGKLYAIVEFDDGDVRHFYNGAEVTEMQTVADGAWDYTTVAKLLAHKIAERSDVSAISVEDRVKVTAKVAGTGFTISTATVDSANVAASAPTASKTTLQANVAGVTEVRATATLTVTGGSSSPGINSFDQVAVGATHLMASAVDWVLSNDATANAIALEITSTAASGYTATASGSVVTITAPPGLGATVNGTALTATVAGNATETDTAFTGGVTAVTAVAQEEEIAIAATSADALDTWEITINGTTYKVTGRSSATPTIAHVVLRRVWCPIGSLLHYCKLSDPTVWSTTAGTAATDPGFIDTAADSEGSEDIISIAEHNGNTAIFSDTNIRVYSLDTDASLIKLIQTLENTGSIAYKTSIQYGNSDVYYLSMTGLRSVRSRLGYNFAYTLDVGSAVATVLQDYAAQVGDSVTRAATAVIEPREGRYMMAIGQKVFALSDYPETGISGWTEIDLGFDFDVFARIGRSVMLRSGATIYVYGGVDGGTYPAAGEVSIIVETPFLTAQDPATDKNDGGFDMAASGIWYVQLLPDPNDTSKTIDVGNIPDITYPKGAIRDPLHTTHCAVRFTSTSGGRATLSNFAMHFDRGE